MSSIDFNGIKTAALAAYPGLLYEWIPGGSVEGHEFKAKNPTRNDGKVGSFSVNISSGKWGDFAVSGAQGGDAIDLYCYLFGASPVEAAKDMAAKLGLTGEPGKDREVQERYAEIKKKKRKPATLWPILPVPRTASKDLPKHKKLGAPSKIWGYKDINGKILGFICRFDLADGGKEVLPLTYCRNAEGRNFWAYKGFPVPRPLYGLEKLAKNPDAIILMLEGEKTADAAQRLLPDFVCMAWPGGGKALGKIDFTQLEGRKVIMWPDADAPGIETASSLPEYLPENTKYFAISPPDDVAKGWDAADAEAEGWTPEQTKKWLRAKFEESKKPKEEQAKEPAPLSEEPAPAIDARNDIPDVTEIPDYPNDDHGGDSYPDSMDYQAQEEQEQFRILGYNRGIYYYLPSMSAQVVELSPAAHSKLNLLQLAPLGYWETHYPKKGVADWDMAANALINMAHLKGVFRPHEQRRGRGAWLDKGQKVVHLGDKLIVDGQQMRPIDYQTAYTYEADSPLKVESLPPATNKEANELIHICSSIRWDNKLSALCLAGWCVVAPICGVLEWRPHIWVTGPAGSGKTTVIRDVIGRVVGPTALQVESKTTEAGIRSELGYDARPIIFDEAEAEDERSAHRMQGNLDLARVASSESGGVMYKGSASGRSVAYRIRSCFCFSSINTSVQHHADETRVTMLVLSRIHAGSELERKDTEAHYKEMMDNIQTYLTPGFASKLIMRSMANLDTLLKNIETFTYAASIVLGNRRIGDQLGPMLAGAYLCHSTKAISSDDAVAWIRQHDFTDHAAIAGRGDEERLLQRIIEHQLRVSSHNGNSYDRTIGELIGAVLDGSDDLMLKDVAYSTLKRNGIRVEVPDLAGSLDGGVYISTTSDAVKRILKGTQWASNWRRPLLSIPSSLAKKAVRFTPALSTPAVLLPLGLFN